MAVAEAIEILAAQHTATTAIEVLPAGIRVHELDIPKKIVAEFLADITPVDRAERFIQALEVGVFCLERAEATRDLDFVRSQVEAILQEVTRQVGAVPQLLEAGLAEKLRAEDGQLLAPIKVLVEGTARTLTERVSSVRELLANDMDPAKSTSTLGRVLSQLKDMLNGARTDSIQGTVAEAIKSVTGEDGTLAKSVKATVAEAIRPLADEVNRIGLQIAANTAAEEVIAKTARKGAPYEEQLVQLLQLRGAAMGAAVLHVGPDNRPGDIVLDFDDTSVAAGLCVVVEARDRTTPVGRKVIASTAANAISARDATFALYVSRTPEGLAAEVGEWTEGSCDGGRWIATTHEHLLVAIRFALLLHRMDQAERERDVVNAHAVAEQVDRIRTALRRVSTVKRHATSIRSSTDAIQEEVEQLNFDVRSALCAIEEQLGSARPE
jgi:hypothetical protein